MLIIVVMVEVGRGEWAGKNKAGVGSYKWPSGARYEGQWSNNTKEGYGIYSYPKGGIYKVRHHHHHHQPLRCMNSPYLIAGIAQGLPPCTLHLFAPATGWSSSFTMLPPASRGL